MNSMIFVFSLSTVYFANAWNRIDERSADTPHVHLKNSGAMFVDDSRKENSALQDFAPVVSGTDDKFNNEESDRYNKIRHRRQINSPTSPAVALFTDMPSVTVTTSFFHLRVYEDTFVDKSLLIKDYLINPHKVILIIRPKQSGKSLNLNMMKQFLEMEDKELQDTMFYMPNSKLFAGGTLFRDYYDTKRVDPLRIASSAECMKHLSQYPVMLMNFPNQDGDSTYEAIVSSFRENMRALFRKYRKYLENSELLTDPDKNKLMSYYNETCIDDELLRDGLRFLSELLHKHFNKTVHVLIDDSDIPFINSYVKNTWLGSESEKTFDLKDFQRTLEFFRDVLNRCLNDNEHVEKALIVGTIQIAGLFSELKNFSEYNLLDKEFCRYFGFTKTELRTLVRKLDVPVKINDLFCWYYGYRIGIVHLFNPRSVIRCLEEKDFLLYWQENSTMLFKQYPISYNFANDLRTVANGGSINSQINQQIDFNYLNIPKVYYSLLLFYGYLTPVNCTDSNYILKAPTKEVTILLQANLKAQRGSNVFYHY